MTLFLLLTLLAQGADPAETAADSPAVVDPIPAEPPEAEERPEPVSPPSERESVDPVAERQREQLERVIRGESVPSISALFAVDLTDVEAVRTRINELEQREVAADSAAGLRLKLLKNWISVYGPLTGPARRIFAELDGGKGGLWTTTRRLDSVESGLGRVAKTLKGQIERARGGGIAGFRVDVNEWLEQAQSIPQAARSAATSIRRGRAATERSARDLSAQAKESRDRFLSAALRSERSALDALFLVTIERQRRLELVDGSVGAGEIDDSIHALTIELSAVASILDGARNVRDVQRGLDRAVTALNSARLLIENIRGLPAHYELAQTRELVTLLLPTISDDAREEAYPLGLELIGELKTELLLFVETTTNYFVSQWHDWTSGNGAMKLGPRVLLALLCLILTGLAQARSPALVSASVKWLARSSLYRGKVGALVRWAGLFHAIAPVAIVMLGGYIALWSLGLELAEVRFLEIGFRWMTLYWLGRRALVGAARRVSSGRPALIDASPQVLDLLQRTYNRFAFVLFFAFIVEDWARTIFALGRLRSVLDFAVGLWVAAWFVYGCLNWRTYVASWLETEFEGVPQVQAVARWMAHHRLGALLVIPGIAALVLARLWSIASDVLLKQGVFAYFKARALRLQSSSTEHKERDSELPDEYVREFPLYPVLGEEGSVLVPKSQELDPILAQFRDWKETRRESSLALVGEKGIGKTTLLSTLRPRLAEAEVSFCTLKERLITPADVVSTLAELFGFDDVETLDGLGQRLTEGPDRAVIIDDAHLSFLRVVDGYRGFEALVQLVNQTGKQVFWILSFNDLAWSFLNAAHGGRAYFRRMQRMTRWSAEELRDLLGRRTKKAGYELEFDEQLMDEQGAGESGIRLIEGAEGFFRLLWESSRGNPRAATWQWLRALTPIGDQRVRVQLFASKKVEALSRASDDVYFALASIAQHENLDETELQATLNVDPSFAGFVLRYLTEYGVVGPKFGAENRYTLKVRHYRDVVQALEARNLLFTEAS